MIIVIVGMPCAGKTTALSVCKELGARAVASGDIVRDEIAVRGLPYNERTDREVAGIFHEAGGERVLVERVLERAGGNPKKDLIVIDGLRSAVQLKELKRMTGVKPVVIAIEASFEQRLKRCVRRHRFAHEDKAYLTSRDKVEGQRGLAELLAKADYKFDTEGMNEVTFKREFKAFVEKMVLKGKM
ncbi:MAG: AAA family ATPase [Candidatus Aenigmarchaeota archaeon]|nr:AAA family ATPase [Candidatus Aenigmarchaeota archaeon]